MPEIFQTLANIATIFGVPIAIIVFLREKNKDRKEEALRAYDSVDEKFINFLEMCAKFPNLHCYLHSDDSIILTEEEKDQRVNIYEILICVFERGFIFYSQQSKKIKGTQWAAWKLYIEKWFQKDSFRNAWVLMRDTYDEEFVHFMNQIWVEQSENITIKRDSQPEIN